MLSEFMVYFIPIVLRINLSSQSMLKFIPLWGWFVKNIKHPEVQEQHMIPESPA